MEKEAIGEGEGVEMVFRAGLERVGPSHSSRTVQVQRKLKTLFLSILVLLLLYNQLKKNQDQPVKSHVFITVMSRA